jgi:hypothetical protein
MITVDIECKDVREHGPRIENRVLVETTVCSEELRVQRCKLAQTKCSRAWMRSKMRAVQPYFGEQRCMLGSE